jgi:hypothetical protein
VTDIRFRRTGAVNPNGSVPGELTIGNRKWPTIERGVAFTFVRRGDYELLMTYKATGRRVRCLCFHEHPAVSSHLIHEALNDSHQWLAGCIAPGLTSDENGIKDSGKAMTQIFDALGGFVEGQKKTITVENNIRGSETKDAWIARRVRRGRG